MHTSTNRRIRGVRAGTALAVLAAIGLGTALAACGGGSGGAGPGGAGQGLALVSFNVAGQDNVSLNQELRFQFSEPVDAASVTNASIQIRRGDAFGLTVQGAFRVVGSEVRFRPVLAGLCDLSDSGFDADTQYRVTIVGHPEAFALRNTKSQPLVATANFEFHTRTDTDPNLFIDPAPSDAPSVLFFEPGDGLSVAPGSPSPAAVGVAPGNRIVCRISENLDPCTVNATNIALRMYETGDSTVFTTAPNGRQTGFVSATDAAPANPLSWGPGNNVISPPQQIPNTIALIQNFDETLIIITPRFGQYPDNALLVLQLSFNIRDYSGRSLTATTFAFTTENLPARQGALTVEFNGDVAVDTGQSTADVNTVRAPSKAQGFLLFAGDGDNGAILTTPAAPAPCTSQVNSGSKTEFAPLADVNLNTGSVVNTCSNVTDGSTAVVFEFSSFRIANGVTVRIVGVNPCIILVQGDVVIESGGALLARPDGGNGAPQGRGGNGSATSTSPTIGGTGVAGGGSGGGSPGGTASTARYGEHGRQGYYYSGATVAADVGTVGGVGAGRGNSSCQWTTQTNNNRNGTGGGGGGHAGAGGTGSCQGSGTTPTRLDLACDGAGGGTYGSSTGRLLKPEAGSGGGAGGEIRPFTGTAGQGPGGAGGAGGGFLDVTAGGSMSILGTIDVAGSQGGGGSSSFNPNYTFNPGSGGGGGGSGGGMRLLTPNNIILGPTTTITAAGGPAGAGGQDQANQAPVNPGGIGGGGRIAFEDSDGILAGYGGAVVTPGEAAPGFYRGPFDASRFSGGGLEPQMVSQPVFLGPLAADLITPAQVDFVAGLPAGAVRPSPSTCALVEMQGFPILPDGSADLTGGTGWRTVGYFRDSGNTAAPGWIPNVNPPPADVLPPAGNLGPGLGFLNGSAYIQMRITFYLPLGIGPLDPGPFVDRWTIRFNFDQ